MAQERPSQKNLRVSTTLRATCDTSADRKVGTGASVFDESTVRELSSDEEDLVGIIIESMAGQSICHM
jgi:hypothetical protein